MRRKSTRATAERNKQVVRDANGVCALCGHDGAIVADHIIPLSKGGPDTRDNLQAAHGQVPCETCGRKCNAEKGSRLIPPMMPRSGVDAF